jgi:D-arabinose 1-dehydrogenase-like Zn-dependent alcohol dehydrogenase
MKQHHYFVLVLQLIHPYDNIMLVKIHEWGIFSDRIMIILNSISYSRVIGLGGLGHMAVKFGVAMGANVTVISTSENKRDDATKLGVKAFLVSKDAEQLKAAENSFDFLIDTVSAPHDVVAMINLLAFQGVYCM